VAATLAPSASTRAPTAVRAQSVIVLDLGAFTGLVIAGPVGVLVVGCG
jgi:hypothetical protein